ncbi:DUF4279 domain-containing protein [Chryseosolibacter indicus]|uniref:DUF4279 domain-containing protein n=1 Tax=Chryseosolibacter indicus TaxID=2782351 RepID=A0ABS5VZ55_9BACT|nr:DUF4279 domain-containing protein [Chryseosolibacter indicus]MBT1706526.1 DUF4279 domain-containing protein [Chryseosolibacter indicus]
MFEEQVLIKVTKEIQDRTKGFTDEFLKVHDIVFVEGRPKIERIDKEREDEIVVAYLLVKEASFYLALYFDNKENLNLLGAGTEPYSSVYFCANSSELNVDDLSALTTLGVIARWTKGQKEQNGPGFHNYSRIEIESNPGPDDVVNKIKKLLDILEKDKDGIKRLVDTAFGNVQVDMRFHVGNKMLFGAPKLDNKTINRLSELDLSLRFNLYAEGKFFKE